MSRSSARDQLEGFQAVDGPRPRGGFAAPSGSTAWRVRGLRQPCHMCVPMWVCATHTLAHTHAPLDPMSGSRASCHHPQMGSVPRRGFPYVVWVPPGLPASEDGQVGHGPSRPSTCWPFNGRWRDASGPGPQQLHATGLLLRFKIRTGWGQGLGLSPEGAPSRA